MNHIELETLKEINRLLDIVIEGKIENLQQAKKAKKLVEEFIEYKGFDNKQAWKLAQD